jgi:hypothetical protein
MLLFLNQFLKIKLMHIHSVFFLNCSFSATFSFFAHVVLHRFY